MSQITSTISTTPVGPDQPAIYSNTLSLAPSSPISYKVELAAEGWRSSQPLLCFSAQAMCKQHLLPKLREILIASLPSEIVTLCADYAIPYFPPSYNWPDPKTPPFTPIVIGVLISQDSLFQAINLYPFFGDGTPIEPHLLVPNQMESYRNFGRIRSSNAIYRLPPNSSLLPEGSLKTPGVHFKFVVTANPGVCLNIEQERRIAAWALGERLLTPLRLQPPISPPVGPGRSTLCSHQLSLHPTSNIVYEFGNQDDYLQIGSFLPPYFVFSANNAWRKHTSNALNSYLPSELSSVCADYAEGPFSVCLLLSSTRAPQPLGIHAYPVGTKSNSQTDQLGSITIDSHVIDLDHQARKRSFDPDDCRAMYQDGNYQWKFQAYSCITSLPLSQETPPLHSGIVHLFHTCVSNRRPPLNDLMHLRKRNVSIPPTTPPTEEQERQVADWFADVTDQPALLPSRIGPDLFA